MKHGFKAAAVLLLLCLVLAGCGGNADKTAETGAAEQPLLLGFSQLGWESAWRLANTESIKAAADRAGVTLMYENAEQKQDRQIKAIRSFIAYQVDVIAFSPIIETDVPDAHLNNNSAEFHAHLGYRMVGEFRQCGYKFGRWYNMVWMEKMLGAHPDVPEAVIPFTELSREALSTAGVEA